ncbi:MAG: glycosyltransferase family 4 protein [candidate division Zixibacteria bacterium]|nr:glycosyltransferase family 4 protein [candidate division Zixibacteria bacterium]
MRVVIFGYALSVHVQRWVRGLARRGLEIKLISLGGEPVDEVETHLLARRGRWSYLTRAAAAVREARRFKPDIVHAHYAAGYGLWGRLCRFCPTIISVWGSDITAFPLHWPGRVLIRSVLNRADHVTVTSRFLQKETLRLAPAVQPRLTVIPFGVSIPETVEPPPAEGPVRICYIKSHLAMYGPDILLRAMAKVKEALGEVTLSMAGEGELTGELQALAARIGLAENVRFTGFIANDDMSSFLKSHHLMVMPSLREAFGVAVLEASACGRAVVASDVGGVGEVLIDGRTGLLTPPGDVEGLAEAIIKLARDADLCNRMGQAGRQLVTEHYSWDKSLDMMTGLYEQVIHESKK